MTNDPAIDNPRRLRMEAGIRSIDMLIYALVFASGIFAALFLPASVTEGLAGYIPLIILWVVFLLFGGVIGFAGRLYRVWALELVGVPSAFFGTLMYMVILLHVAVKVPTAWVAVVLMAVACAGTARRWLELNIFTEPAVKLTMREAWKVAMARRTADLANQH